METQMKSRLRFRFRTQPIAIVVIAIVIAASLPPGTHSHWINLHVWYEDPLLSASDSSVSGTGTTTTLHAIDGLQNASASVTMSTLHGMMQQDQQEGQGPPEPPQGYHGERQLPPCEQLHGLTQAQIDMCLVFRDHMKSIVNGAKLGLSECRWQFRYNHWNCSSPPNLNEYYQYSTVDAEVTDAATDRQPNFGPVSPGLNMNSVNTDEKVAGSKSNKSKGKGKGKSRKGKKSASAPMAETQAKTKKRSILSQDLQDKLNQQFNSVWNAILKQGSKEVAFAHAVWSAAVTQSIARACREGSLASCSCGRTPRPPDLKREWKWGGCGDNLQYGYKFATDFVDSREKAATDSKVRAKALVNLHNNEAGRRAVLRKTKIACKCHGVSGSCALVTCWHQIPSFREIGDYLKDSYGKATLVKMNKRGRLQVKKAGVAVPSVHDLLYVENSPNYCVENSTLGVFGQSGRICNPNTKGPDSCANLCCNGKGYTTNTIRSSQRCHCKFVWCCSVQCQECKQVQRVTSCN